MKFSAIVELRVNSHSYKFQLDQSNFCLTMILNKIGSYIGYTKIMCTFILYYLIQNRSQFWSINSNHQELQNCQDKALQKTCLLDFVKYIPLQYGENYPLVKHGTFVLYYTIWFRTGVIFSASIRITKTYKVVKTRPCKKPVF